MILVIQFRENTDLSKEHERQCILARLERPEPVRFCSVFEDAAAFSDPAALLRGVDKVILGGNAAIPVTVRDLPGADYGKGDFILRTSRPLLDYLLDNDTPTLATCFGHQLFAHHLGTEIVRDPVQAETGIVDITLTPAGKQDPLFAGVPAVFAAVIGHQLSLSGLPRGAMQLASSERCSLQAIRYGNHIYTTQFHSELDEQDLAFRLRLFPGYKSATSEQTLASRPIPYGVAALRNFLKDRERMADATAPRLV